MPGKKENPSLDDILNDIRKEREIKAGLTEPEEKPRSPQEAEKPEEELPDSLPETDTANEEAGEEAREPDGEQEEEKPASEFHRPANSIDELVEEYLTGTVRRKPSYLSPKAGSQKTKFVKPTKISRDELYIPLKAPEEAAEGEKKDGADGEDGEGEQMKLSGYSDTDPMATPDIVSEEEEEARLIDRRQKQIDEFRVFTSGLHDEALLEIERKEENRGRKRAELFDRLEVKTGEGLFDAVDNIEEKPKKKKPAGKFVLGNNPTQIADEKKRGERRKKKKFDLKVQKKNIEDSKTKAFFSCIMSAIITFVLVFLALLPKLYSEGGRFEALLGGSGRVYLGMNLALTVIAAALSYETIRSSVKSILRLSVNSDTVVFIALFFSVFHNTALLIKGGFMQSGGILYNGAAAFSLLLNSLTKLFITRRMEINLKTLTKIGSLHSVQAIENRADANQLAYGISENGNPGILYSASSEIPASFSALSLDRSGEERFFGFAVPAILVAGIIAGIAGAIHTKDILGFLTAFTGCICVCLPVTMTFISNYLILRCERELSKDESAILGFSGIANIEAANALIMDAKELFYAEVSNFHTVRTSSVMTEEDAITFAGAILTKGSSILSDVFAQIIKQQNINLPAVEDLKYEDRLGFSAWVNEYKVLVGNRDMMTQHNVPLPPLTDVEKSGTAASETVYVAVEEKLAAMFNVRYLMGKNTAKQVKRLTDNGIVLMLMTQDPALTEEFVSSYAKVKSNSIKITTSKARDIMKLYEGRMPRRKESGLLCGDSAGGMLRMVNAAFRLVNADRQASTIQLISLFIAAGVGIGMVFFDFLSPVVVIAYQVIFGLISCFVSEKTLNNK